MNELEIRQVIHALDHALNVFRQNEGRLTAAQVRARSMISITRSEVAQSLSDACHDRLSGTERFIDPVKPAGEASGRVQSA
jgi:hypothetical protein